MLVAVLEIYLAIGLAFIAVGPGRREISRQVADVRTSPGVSRGKLIAFRLLLSIAAAAAWPLLGFVAVNEGVDNWRRARREAEGIEFSRMGGAGAIHCDACGFEERITPFMHGFTFGPDASCDQGFQCLSCGKFQSVHRKGNPPVTPEPRCQCGGELSRDHILFCPACRSKRMRYGMRVIS